MPHCSRRRLTSLSNRDLTSDPRWISPSLQVAEGPDKLRVRNKPLIEAGVSTMEVRNESPTITFSALPREEMIVVQKLCEEFEERFAADGNCRIADLLVRANERLHPVLLRELIGTALEAPHLSRRH